MKIVKKCDDSKIVPKPKPIAVDEIPPQTVFRHGDHSLGPYIRTMGYIVVDLSGHFATKYDGNTTLLDYLPLPNAKLVTGEE